MPLWSLLLPIACVARTPAGEPAYDEEATPPSASPDRPPPCAPGEDPGGDTGVGEDTADTGAGHDTGADTGPGCTPPSLPADILDLVDWKLTLPVAASGESDALEVTQPDLATYSVDPWFFVRNAATGVTFRANAGGATTSGSSYPRSELREMTAGGAERASWSTTEGRHTLTITQAITHLPEVKAHVVAGQIHDAEDDVVMIRLEDTHLYVEGGGEDLGLLDADYALGERFTVRIDAADGWIDVYYEDLASPAVSVARETDGCYFKAGVYTQSNPDRGDSPDAYGEVEITDLSIDHG